MQQFGEFQKIYPTKAKHIIYMKIRLAANHVVSVLRSGLFSNFCFGTFFIVFVVQKHNSFVLYFVFSFVELLSDWPLFFMALDYLCANAKSSKQGVGPLNKETKVTEVISKNETSSKCYRCFSDYKSCRYFCKWIVQNWSNQSIF